MNCPARRSGSSASVPLCHPGLRAGVHPGLPMPPQPVKNGIDRLRRRRNRGWAPAFAGVTSGARG